MMVPEQERLASLPHGTPSTAVPCSASQVYEVHPG